MKKWVKTALCGAFLLVLCFCLVACDSDDDSQSSKSRHKGIEIYPVNVTKVKIENAGESNDSDDCDITVEGTTDAPDGSIVYAQHPVHGEMSVNKAYGGEYGDDDNKVKHHHISFEILASNVFDLENMKVGQKAYLKIFCAKQKFSEYEKIYLHKDSSIISKKVRKRLDQAHIKPYPIVATKYMVHSAQYN